MYLFIGTVLALCVIFFALAVVIIEGIHATKCKINDENYKHSLGFVHEKITNLGYINLDNYYYNDYSSILGVYILLIAILTGFFTLVLWPLIGLYLGYNLTVNHLRDIKRLKKELSSKDCK